MTENSRTDQTLTEPRAKLLDLSLPQLIGGSLAAATTAALGSRLGVVGTITGAAIGSVVTAIAASLYTNSMTRARDVIVTTWRPGTAGVQAVSLRQPNPSGAAARRVLLSTAAVFVIAGAFLAGVQLATGTDVSGTSVGTRGSSALPAAPDASDRQAGADDAPATGSATTTAPATPAPGEVAPPESTPQETSPPPTTVPGVVPPSDPAPTAPTATEPVPTPTTPTPVG